MRRRRPVVDPRFTATRRPIAHLNRRTQGLVSPFVIDLSKALRKGEDGHQFGRLGLAGARHPAGAVQQRADSLGKGIIPVKRDRRIVRRRPDLVLDAGILRDRRLADLDVRHVIGQWHRAEIEQIAQIDIVTDDFLHRHTLQGRKDPVLAEQDRHRPVGQRLVARAIHGVCRRGKTGLGEVRLWRRDQRIDRQIADHHHSGGSGGSPELRGYGPTRTATHPGRQGHDRDLKDRTQDLGTVITGRPHPQQQEIALIDGRGGPAVPRNLDTVQLGHQVRTQDRIGDMATHDLLDRLARRSRNRTHAAGVERMQGDRRAAVLARRPARGQRFKPGRHVITRSGHRSLRHDWPRRFRPGVPDGWRVCPADIRPVLWHEGSCPGPHRDRHGPGGRGS